MSDDVSYELEFRPAVGPAIGYTVTAPVEIGREGDGIVLPDPSVSRRHARLEVTAEGLVVSDLASTNGTRVNGVRITGPTVLQAGDTMEAGACRLVVVGVPEPAQPSPPTAAFPASPTTTGPAAAPPITRPVVSELAALESPQVVVRYTRGTPGETAAKGMLDAARQARRRLTGLGSEPWGTVPQICLVGPFPDPADGRLTVAEGTVVDAARGEIWMVATPEAPAEPPGRPLALFFGASLPAAVELEPLLEGFGLHIDDTPDVDDRLRTLTLPPLAGAEGELRAAMALSFVRWLVAREGEDGLRRLLGTATPGRIDEAAREVYGTGLAELESDWQQGLSGAAPQARPAQFLRLSARYLKPHLAREAEIFVYMLLGLVFTVTFPFITKRIFDTALPSGEYGQVLTLLGILGAAFLISLLAGLRRAYLSAYVSGAVVRELRAEMFAKLQRLSTGWFTRHQQGDVIGRLFSDVQQVENGLSKTLTDGIFQVVSLIVASVVMLRLNVQLGLVTLAGAPLVAIVYRAMGAGAQRRSLAVQEESGRLIGVTAENYHAQPVVKLFGLAGRERDRFRRTSDRLFRAERRLNLFGGLFGLSVNTIVTILRLGILAFGTWLVLEGRFTVGGLVAFMSIMGEVLSPVTVLTGVGQELQQATGSLVRIDEILAEPPEVVDDPDSPPLPPLGTEIRLTGVGFSYNAERRILHDVEVLIPAGSRVAFVGPSGSGKSTVLRLLMRLYDPSEGVVSFDGRDLRGVRLESLRAQLGAVFQDTFLFDTTIRENIALGRPGATDAEVEAAARAAEVDAFVAALPRGYDTLVGEGGGMLSGGQRQRVAIARALIRDPRVLLLDEATSALDPRTERQIVTTLQRASQGRTTVAITHRLTSVVEYDRIFVVVDGAVVERGTHSDLLATGGVYARLWAEQTGGEVLTTAPFEVAEALGRVPLFAELRPFEVAVVAGRLRSREVAAGQRIAEGGGRLFLVSRGRARVLVPSLGGDLVANAELDPGDCFGLKALLGQETGAVLEAVGPLTLLELDDEAIAGLAAQYETVGRALVGAAAGGAVPAGGRRLARPTFGPGQSPRASVIAAAGPSPARLGDEVRRATGAFPSAR